MRDRERCIGLVDVHDRRQGRLRAAAGRRDIELLKSLRIALIMFRGFQNHAVLVGLCVDDRNLPLTEGVVEDVIDILHGNAEPAHGFAVDAHDIAQSAALRFRRDIAQGGFVAQRVDELLRPAHQLVAVGRRDRILILRSAGLRRDLDVLDGLDIERRARYRLGFTLEPVGDGVRAVVTTILSSQDHREMPDIGGRVQGTDAEHRGDARDVLILAENLGDVLLHLLHRVEGNVGRRLQNDREHACVLARQEALRDDDIKRDGQSEGRGGQHQDEALML